MPWSPFFISTDTYSFAFCSRVEVPKERAGAPALRESTCAPTLSRAGEWVGPAGLVSSRWAQDMERW